jgi:hypothetical protein
VLAAGTSILLLLTIIMLLLEEGAATLTQIVVDKLAVSDSILVTLTFSKRLAVISLDIGLQTRSVVLSLTMALLSTANKALAMVLTFGTYMLVLVPLEGLAIPMEHLPIAAVVLTGANMASMLVTLINVLTSTMIGLLTSSQLFNG